MHVSWMCGVRAGIKAGLAVSSLSSWGNGGRRVMRWKIIRGEGEGIASFVLEMLSLRRPLDPRVETMYRQPFQVSKCV